MVAGSWVGADDPSIHFRTITYGQGAYMALPIVGKFYNKLYADPKYSFMRIQWFDQPDENLLAQMNEMEPWVEVIRPTFDLREIFRGRDAWDKQEDEKLRERKKLDGEEEKEPVWEIIRRIFKKKD
jgi:penicillin-binding protein 1A